MKTNILLLIGLLAAADSFAAIYDIRQGREITAAANAVKADTLYDLTFTARYHDDRGNHDINLPSAMRPVCFLRFFDAAGKLLDQTPFGRPRRRPLPFGDDHLYRIRFYAPPEAVKLELKIQPPAQGGAIEVKSVSLQNAPEQNTRNINPDFKLGADNLSGWTVLAERGGALLAFPDGSVRLDSGYGSGSEYFPMKEPGTYRFTVRSLRYGGYNEAILFLYDRNGKQIDKIGLYSYPCGASAEFVKNPAAEYGRLLVYDNVMESVEVRRIGDTALMQQINAERKKNREMSAALKQAAAARKHDEILRLCSELEKSELLAPQERFAILAAQGKAYAGKKEYAAAEEKLRQAVSGVFGAPAFERYQVYAELTKNFLSLKKEKEAVAWYSGLADAPGTSPEEKEFLLQQLAGIYERLGDSGRAVEILRTMAFDPQCSFRGRLAAARRAAVLCRVRKDDAEASRILTRMMEVPGVKKQAEQVRLLHLLSEFKVAANDYEGALKALQEAETFRQDSAEETAIRLIVLHAKFKKYDEMLRASQKTARLSVLSPEQRAVCRQTAVKRVMQFDKTAAEQLKNNIDYGGKQ